MFEFDQYSAPERGAEVRADEKLNYAAGIRKRAWLIWSEHCIECAAPECYQTCDLYQARPDQRCRRFETGMRRNNHLRGQTGSAADIVFGQWGKLETRGNTRLLNNRLLLLIETVVPPLQKLINAFGRVVRRFGGSAPWTSLSFELFDYAAKRMQQASRSKEKPDGFLIEIYNPAQQSTQVKFGCTVASSKMMTLGANGKLALPYWKQLDIDPGYNRWFVPYADLSEVVESELPYNISFTPEEESGTRLVFISTDFVTVDDVESIMPSSQVSSPQEPAAKCVVFDLDNTLWDGVMVEGEVTLKPTVPAMFKSLDERGILISVASKNNQADALKRLEGFGLAEYLVHPVINWNQKSENIKTLAQTISIGTDTLLFIDDSPFEREEVSGSVPGIEVLPETELDHLLDHPRLQGARTKESANRRVMYQQQAQRSEAAIAFGTDYLAFLKTCEIEVSVGSVNPSQHERVTELLQRTNQLNFSGAKYTRDAVDELLRSTDADHHVIHCKDKYGDYGLVGFSITKIEHQQIVVQDFMLSCRVQGKLIEKAFFSYLVNKYGNEARRLSVNFVATNRNDLARSVLQEIGFSMEEGAVSMTVEPDQLDVDFLDLRTDTEKQNSHLVQDESR